MLRSPNNWSERIVKWMANENIQPILFIFWLSFSPPVILSDFYASEFGVNAAV